MEKIWIAYGVKDDWGLCFEDLQYYIKKCASIPLIFTDSDLLQIYMCMELDDDKLISKKNLFLFISILLQTNEGLKFNVTSSMCDLFVSKSA